MYILFLQMMDLNQKIELPSETHFKHFNRNPPRLWDFESFKNHKTAQSNHPPRDKRIRATYNKVIQDIAALSDISVELKEY